MKSDSCYKLYNKIPLLLEGRMNKMNKKEQEMIKIIAETTKESSEVVNKAWESIKTRAVACAIETMEANSDEAALKIINRLAESWGSMTKEEQEETSKVIAGRFQMGRFMALLEGLSQKKESENEQ